MSDKLLRKVLQVIEEFRKLDPGMPTQTVSTFLRIALKPGITTSEIESELGLAMSSTSRNVAILSARGWPKGGKREPGHGLIEYEEDSQDARRKKLRLTRQGQTLARHISVIMED